MSEDSPRKPKSIPIPPFGWDSERRAYEDAAARVRSRLDGMNVRLTGALAERAGQRAAPKRVLVVDDDEDCLALTCAMLERLGHTVARATRGLDALAKAAELKPDAVVLDLGLPDLDGCTIARRIRLARGTQCPLLIAHTASAGAALKGAAYAAGIDHLLFKPAGAEDFAALLMGHAATVK